MRFLSHWKSDPYTLISTPTSDIQLWRIPQPENDTKKTSHRINYNMNGTQKKLSNFNLNSRNFIQIKRVAMITAIDFSYTFFEQV